MNVVLENNNSDCSIIRLNGSITFLSSSKLVQAISTEKDKRLLIDASGIGSIDYAGFDDFKKSLLNINYRELIVCTTSLTTMKLFTRFDSNVSFASTLQSHQFSVYFRLNLSIQWTTGLHWLENFPKLSLIYLLSLCKIKISNSLFLFRRVVKKSSQVHAKLAHFLRLWVSFYLFFFFCGHIQIQDWLSLASEIRVQKRESTILHYTVSTQFERKWPDR